MKIYKEGFPKEQVYSRKDIGFASTKLIVWVGQRTEWQKVFLGKSDSKLYVKEGSHLFVPIESYNIRKTEVMV